MRPARNDGCAPCVPTARSTMGWSLPSPHPTSTATACVTWWRCRASWAGLVRRSLRPKAPSPSAFMSMRSRVRAAACSGCGTSIRRRVIRAWEPNPSGGGEGLTDGRSSQSARAISRGGFSRCIGPYQHAHRSIRLPSMCSKRRRGVSCIRSTAWPSLERPTSMATASPTCGANMTASCARSAVSLPKPGAALGLYQPAVALHIARGSNYVLPAGADLDGDGIGDALIGSVRAPNNSAGQSAGSRTLVARSGATAACCGSRDSTHGRSGPQGTMASLSRRSLSAPGR